LSFSALKFLKHFCDWTVRITGIAFAVLVLSLSAPLLDTAIDQQQQIDIPPRQPEPFARVDVTLRRGDTLLSVLTRFGLTPLSARGIVDKVRPLLNLRALRPGHNVQIVVDPQDRSVQGMEVTLETSLVSVKSTAEGWSAERHEIPFVRESRTIHGTIAGSLYESGIEAGLTPQQILDLARIFEYDIDFFSDFQRGDTFAAVVEQLRYADGRRVGGRILAAQLEPNGETASAFYFVAPDGSGAYYDSEGRALRRSFLRAPLSYVRISSSFSLAREHPIFRTVRPHQAIDYAAPTGTPAVAIGPGRVEFAGWSNGYGNLVEIRHANGYVSRYAHFSRIASGIRKGSHVEGGDVVGYVGQTGNATGPHLHFEFLKDGQKINFLALKIPGTDRLAGGNLQTFTRSRDERLAELHGAGNEVAHARSDL
jgi:murein DD-endopeptidase MepM/ murein hydrolase activator NlpD